MFTRACRYIHRVTNTILSRGFYRSYVKLDGHTPPPELVNHPTLHFFHESRGAVDGTHFPASVPENDAPRYRNRKGYLSQNVLAVCNQSAKFVYVLAGWEGSASDSRVFDSARKGSLRLPQDCYFLGDAGFPICDLCLTPYRGTRYHLKEWARGNQKYVYPLSLLFNLNFVGQATDRRGTVQSPSFSGLKHYRTQLWYHETALCSHRIRTRIC